MGNEMGKVRLLAATCGVRVVVRARVCFFPLSQMSAAEKSSLRARDCRLVEKPAYRDEVQE